MNVRKQLARESYGFLAIIAGIIVLLNILGLFYFGRLDLTEKRLFSLSEGSERLAGKLKDRMEVTAYFTKNLPPPFNATERYVRDILAEYQAASKGKIRFTFIDPDTDEKRSAADQDGVRRVSHQVIENDSVNMREGYRGLVFNYLGERKAIPVIENTTGLEYRISETIKELVGDKNKVGVLSGFGALGPEKGLSSLRSAAPTYDFQSIDGKSPIPSDVRALVVASPNEALPEETLRHINAFVMNGGSLAVLGGSIAVDTQGFEPAAKPANTGLNKLLAAWGVTLKSDIVADVQCSRAPMPTSFGMPVLVPYPPVPIITFDKQASEHPALLNLDQVTLPFASQVEILDSAKSITGLKVSVLGRSTENAWLMEGESISLRPRDPREWHPEGKRGPFNVLVALEGILPSAFAGQGVMSAESSAGESAAPSAAVPDRSTKPVRVFVAGSASFVNDEFLPQAQRGGPQPDMTGILALGLNIVDWLAQDLDLIATRAKQVEDPVLNVPSTVLEAEGEVKAAAEARDRGKAEAALEKRKDALKAWEYKKSAYRWLNTLGLPVLFALYGVMRWRKRRARKIALAAA